MEEGKISRSGAEPSIVQVLKDNFIFKPSKSRKCFSYPSAMLALAALNTLHQNNMEIAALRAENARLKQIISHFITGRNQEASSLLDLQHGLLEVDEPTILEGRVVMSTTREQERTKHRDKQTKHRDKRSKVPKECEDAEVTHLKPLSSMTLQEVLTIWNEKWTHLNKDHLPL